MKAKSNRSLLSCRCGVLRLSLGGLEKRVEDVRRNLQTRDRSFRAEFRIMRTGPKKASRSFGVFQVARMEGSSRSLVPSGLFSPSASDQPLDGRQRLRTTMGLLSLFGLTTWLQ